MNSSIPQSGADPGFQTRGFDLGPPKAFLCGGVGGILPRKILKFKSSEMRFPTF